MAIVSKDEDEDLTWVRFGSAPLIVTLVLPLVIGVILLLKCILNHCCVRKSTAKDEMYGVEGRMTILVNSETSFITAQPPPSQPTTITTTTSARTTTTSQQPVKSSALANNRINNNSSERSNESNLGSAASSREGGHGSNEVNKSSPVPSSSSSAAVVVTITEVGNVNNNNNSESYEILDLTSDSVKSSTLHRQLPDLPQPPNHLQGPHPPRRSSSLLSHDGTSELYATVGEVPNPADEPVAKSSRFGNGKVREKGSRSGGLQPGTSKGAKGEPSSDSETYGNSGGLNHPYAKLKRNVAEHPYARVRTGSTGTGGDEETDTDNYDTPQPYAQTGSAVAARLASQGGTGPGVGGISSSQGSSRDVVDSANTNSGAAGPSGANPVPPRRTGRQWRRGSHPAAQAYENQGQQHFSGDSQDSRGYTSISVREPLSNIIPHRNPPGARAYDSHYATVSDDSEEMYAAIEDAEGNYMRIPEEDGEPGTSRHWHGPNIASPIPERREANSPLPPPPVPPLASPPELSPTGPAAVADPNPSTSQSIPSTPPVYAQVTKKSKKSKAPVTPTISGPSVLSSSSSSSQPPEKKPVAATSSLPANSPQLSTTSNTTNSNVKTRNSEKVATLMSPTSGEPSEPRRWSKADISYSEFEVVREPAPLYSVPRKPNKPPPSESSSKHYHSSGQTRSAPPQQPQRPSHQTPAQQQQPQRPSHQPPAQQQHPQRAAPHQRLRAPDLIDEDNYNVIPEDTSRRENRSASKTPPHHRRNSNNYQEINDLDISNPYHEIQPKESGSDYYQEIGTATAGSSGDNRNGLDSANLYQEIDKKVPSTQHDALDDEDDPADQFYETVKPAAAQSKQASLSTSTAMKHLPSPSHSQGSVTSLDRKHGYEKLKKKSGSPTVVVIASDDDDEDEDDDTKNEDSLYERVKYPPYERLKESRDDLREDLPLDSVQSTDQFYEDIGYTRVKAKKAEAAATEAMEPQPSVSSKTVETNDEEPNLDQLYARVDKTKKKKNTNTSNATAGAAAATAGTTAALASSNRNHSNTNNSSQPQIIEIRREEKVIQSQACILLRTEGEEDESIEYI